MKNVYLTLSFLLLFVLSLSAQRNCGSMDYLEQQIQDNPALIQQMQVIEEHTERFAGQTVARNVITIPVVVHVVYNTSAENISDAQIQTQIDVLNDDFRRMNSDADNAPCASTSVRFSYNPLAGCISVV